MARFLSDEWFAEVNESGVTVDQDVSFVLEQRVTGGPGGPGGPAEVRYRVILSGGRLTVARLPPVGGEEANASPADVVLRLDYATAEALAAGRLTAHEAFLDARVAVSGNLARLQQAAPALAAVARALGAPSPPRRDRLGGEVRTVGGTDPPEAPPIG